MVFNKPAADHRRLFSNVFSRTYEPANREDPGKGGCPRRLCDTHRPLLCWLFNAEPGNVESRQEQQGQQGRDNEPPDDGVSHRPPEYLGRDRDHAERGGGCGQYDRPEAVCRRVDHRIPRVQSPGLVHVDLIDQDHRIADNHPTQRDNSEDRDKPHRRAGRQQSRDDADQPQRCDADHQEHLLKALQLDHQNDQHQYDHQRKHSDDRVEPFGALLDRAARLNRVIRRQFLCHFSDRRRQLLIDGFCLYARHDVGLNRDGRQQIAAPDHRRLQAILDIGDLAQRDRLAVVQCDLQISQGL